MIARATRISSRHASPVVDPCDDWARPGLQSHPSATISAPRRP